MDSSFYNSFQTNPLLPLLSYSPIPALPPTVFDSLQREWNELKQYKVYPSVCGDMVRLAVLWSVLLPWIGKEDVVKRVIEVGMEIEWRRG